jgi:L-amino acid N-acyltransferase YncA
MTSKEVRPDLVVRAAVDTDAQHVAAIFAHYARTTTATFETEPRTPEQWQTAWASLRQAGWPCLVATIDAQVIGFAYIGPWRTKPAYRHTVETTVYLAPDRTGLGYGRVLTTRLLEAAAANGAREVIAVIADTGNPASTDLHRRLGFTHVGTLHNVGHKFNRLIDVHLMQKALNAHDA